MVDLRSDTITMPTPAMRDAMQRAELGDDVLGDDPTVISLQEKIAGMLGKDAALFVPSGTMGNQLAIRAQVEPGDEVIAHEDSHIIHYEGGAPAALSGCSILPLRGPRGFFEESQVHAAIRPTECHFAQSRLLVVENTCNRGGGSIWPLEQLAGVARAGREHGLRIHLDGARLFNASVASGVALATYAEHFDTISICFSKGLGAPVGSALVGDAETVRRAHRFRKLFGGAMRQSGLLAAAAAYALDAHLDRLADDHVNAMRLATALAGMPAVRLDPATVETNIVFFDIDSEWGTAADVAERLARAGVRMMALGPQRLRAVTHLDVDSAGIDKAIACCRQVLS